MSVAEKHIPKLFRLPSPLEEDIALSEVFASCVVSSNIEEYRRRNQDGEKVLRDIYMGKLAECSVFRFFLSKNKTCTPPDFMVYAKNHKNFNPDLMVQGGLRVHVKSCKANTSFPISWVFQPQDSLVTRPLATDWLALVVFEGKVPTHMYLKKATEVVFGEAISPKLDKKVVYLSDFS